MVRLPFPRWQVLRDDGTWLPWIEADCSVRDVWCNPDIPEARESVSIVSGEAFGDTRFRAVLIHSQEESDRLGRLVLSGGKAAVAKESTK